MKNKVHILQFPDKRATIGYKISPQSDGTLRIDAALARVNPKDQYNRKIGRSIVTGRLSCDRLSNKAKLVDNLMIQDKMPVTFAEWRALEIKIAERILG